VGTYPDVSLEKARARHQAAPRLLAADVDASPHRQTLRQRRRVCRNSRCKKRGTPATGQPVREFESRPLRRIECDCPVLDPLRTVVTVRIRRIKKASHSRTLALGCGSGINPLQNNTCGRSTVTVWIRYRNVSRSMVASYESRRNSYLSPKVNANGDNVNVKYRVGPP
jgi:hypothetical protein